MSCRVTKDKSGNIIKVLDSNGKESKLFKQIAELPHVKSLEEAVAIYDEILKANPTQDAVQSGFYSNTLAALSGLKDKNVKNVKGWVNQLTDVQKNGGIKNVGQELEWLGLEDFLNSWVEENKPKNGNIPFDVVQEYVEDNQMDIVEISKGKAPLVLTPNEEEPHILEVFRPDDPEGDSFGNIGEIIIQENGKFLANVPGIPQREFSTLDGARNYIEQGTDYATETKYQNYQLKSGEGYREVLLTLPNKNTVQYEFEAVQIGGTGRWVIHNKTLNKEHKPFGENLDSNTYDEENAKILAKNLSKNKYQTDDKPYKSSHWTETNILAHVRMNERVMPNGERVLFIEEIQSDWAQEGKKKGFEDKKTKKEIPTKQQIIKLFSDAGINVIKPENTIENLTRISITPLHLKRSSERGEIEINPNSEVAILMGKIDDSFKDSATIEEKRAVDSHLGRIQEITSPIKNAIELYTGEVNTYDNSGRKTPDMPYKKTDQWVGMAMRRVMQMAVQEGFDRIAWANGEQQVNRYSLSKQISSLRHYKNGDGTYGIVATDLHSGEVAFERFNIKEEELEEIVGKEMASKIINREGKEYDKYGINAELRSYGRATGVFERNNRWYVKHENTERGTFVSKEDAQRDADRFNKDYIDNPKENSMKELSGIELEVGGEGMKTFYDSILPKIAKKEAQRFDKKANVEIADFRGRTTAKNDETVKTMIANLEAKDTLTPQEEKDLADLKSAADAVKRDAKTEARQQLSIPITKEMKADLLSPVPFFSLQSNNKEYSNFKEAIDDTTEKTIDIVSNGKVVASFPSSLDERTLEGAINSFISDGIIKPNKVTFNGKTYFQTTGETVQDRMISEEYLKEVIGQTLNSDQYTISNGLVELRPKIEGQSSEGSLHRVISDKILEYFSNDTVISKKDKIDENNLKLNLMKILSDMGVSVISLKQYQDRFKQKSKNIPPSAEALADIANRVIAFKDGQLTLDNLTEEVMHLIVETLPAEQVKELSQFIKDSKEYQDYYEQYKEVYNNNEDLIEKEILGKILKNITLNKVGDKPQTFLGRLFDILRNFFNSLKLTQSHKDQLAQLNGIVDRFVIEQNGSNFTEDDLAQSREIALMYSLSEQVSNAQGAFEKAFKNITDFRQFNSYKRELKNINFENLKGRELAVAVSRFIEMSTKLIETTESAIKTAKEKRKSLSGQNKAILEDLDNEIASNLDSLAVELSSPQPGIKSTERTKLADKLRENSAKISELRALNDQTTDDHIKQLVEEVVVQMGEAESDFYREQVEKVLRGEIDDTNKLFSFFGQLHHASNPVLNMIGSKIWEMNMKANQGIKEDMADFLNYVEDNKISNEQLSSLFKNGYLEDVVDHKAFDDALLTAEMEAFSEVSGQTFTDLDAYKRAKAKDELNELNQENYGKYRTLLQQKQLPLTETIMNEKYYKDLFDKYERLNISGATQSFLKQNSADRGAIKANATKTFIDEDGNKKSRVVLSPDDNNVLNSISKIRKARKNIYSETSTLKKGLVLSTEKPAGESVMLPTGQYLSLNLTDDMSQGEKDFANIAFDLHKLDNDYAEQVKAEGAVPNTATGLAIFNFLDYLQSIQDTHSEREMYDITMSNLDISLSQEFYDTLNGDSFLKGDTLDKLNPDNLQLVKDVKELYAKRNSILSMYRNTSSPFEIDRMTSSDQESIRSLSLRISNALRELKLPEGVEENESAGEKAPNKAYLAELERRGIEQNTQEELEFLINSQHTNVPQLNKLRDAYYKNEAGFILSDSDARMIDKYLGEDLITTQLNYAKANLQPYYTRFAPIGYKSVEERLSDGEAMADIVKDVFENRYLNVRIDNSFEEKDNPLKNPDYNDEYDGGFRQPKKGTFVNNDFINKFGINAQGQATKNKELFEARRLYLEARKIGLEKMNEKGYNPYKAIQISKTTTEKVRTLAKGKNKRATAKELLKDTFAYRVDDVAYGEKGFETNRMLPKYYTKDLEDPTDVSTDYVFALAQFVSRANEYKAKRSVISDIDALYDVLLRSKRHSKSKDLKNTIAMANSYIDNSIYGKIENRTYEVKVPGTDYSMDLAKVSRVFTKYVSLKNLGFNTTVPLTGLITGVVVKKVEEWIGEKLNKDSARLATAEYKRLFKDGRSQALDFNDNSKLFLIGQAFGIYDISEKARNAKYNKFQRTFSKSAMALHTMANYPIIPKIALAVMYDNRIIDGKIVNRAQFFQENTRNGVPKENIETRWKAAEDNAIYNYMNFSKTGFTWDARVEKLIPDTKYLEDRKLFMMKFIRNQISIVDGTLPQEMRIAAQRDALGSMMLLHKGFLSIFLQNRLKRRNLNIDTGLIEEGSYRTLARLMADFFNTEGNMSAKIDKLKASIKPPSPGASNTEWLEYELNIRNMRRIGKELATMGILVTLGALVFAAASDPDNEDIYALQMTSYLTTRLLNESATNFTPSIFTDLGDVIESPIVSYDTGKEFMQAYKLFDSSEITTGKYKGLTVRERWITKNVLGFKGIYDVWSAKHIRDSEKTYRLYNEENIDRATLGLNSLYKSFYKD